MPVDLEAAFARHLAALNVDYNVRGVLTADDRVLPLGTDTKVLSTIFEAFARPVVYAIAEESGLTVHEAAAQNSYPDFTLLSSEASKSKLAVDVKTTYIDTRRPTRPLSFTLGSYTSFIRPGNERRGIEFPYSDYEDHWIMAYVYSRQPQYAQPSHFYPLTSRSEVPCPFTNVTLFVRRKWELAGDVPGSGNTANIGSRRATVAVLRDGPSLFRDEAEFLEYWRGYGRRAEERPYNNISGFRGSRVSAP